MSKIDLHLGDAFKIMPTIKSESFDLIYVDPPYRLSNDGFSCQNGKKVSVNKGEWDKSEGFEKDLEFHENWISESKRILKPNGTIFISGTYHSIFQCGYVLQKNNWHILNDISWFKPNASPNLSGRMFTASHESLIWARKDKKAKHTFNYDLMREMDFPRDQLKTQGKQMRSVWSISTPQKSEKVFGKHPTQKPLALLARIVLAATNEGDSVFDPFMGSGTKGVACKKFNRSFTGVEFEKNYFKLAESRISSAKQSSQNEIYSILQNKNIISIPDYAIGVETGLDSNGRKNRSGTAMEGIVEYFVSNMCKKNNWQWISQATQQKIKELWNREITVEKSSRRIDFAIFANNKLYLIETNFYGGGGSKLKSTAGEYKTDFKRWKNDGHEFIWITDSKGWKTTSKPLNETFDDTDYIINLDMLEKGILEDVVSN